LQRLDAGAEARAGGLANAESEKILSLFSSLTQPLPEKFPGDLFDALPVALYATDADGVVTYYNKAAEDLAGRTPVVGKDKWCVTWRLYAQDGAPLAHDQCPMALTLKEKRAVRGIEAVAERPDGTRVPFMPFPTPVFDATGKMVGAVNLLVDLRQRNAGRREAAKRQQAEDALTRRAREQTALYRFTDRLQRVTSAPEIFEAALDAMHEALACERSSILLFDATQVMKFVAWRGLSEAYRHAVEGHSPWRPDDTNATAICIEDVDDASEFGALKATIRAEGIGALAFVPLIADGKLIGKFMTYYDGPHRYNAGEVEVSLAIARQLAFRLSKLRSDEARRIAEDKLRRESEMLHALMDAAPIMITMYHPNGGVVRLNRAFERLMGWTTKEAAGISLMEECLPDPAQRAQAIAFIAAPDDRWMDIRMRTRDARDLDTTWANVRLSDGMQIGLGLDISERKRDELVRQRLAAIVESSDDAIVSKNLSGVIVSWNKSAERLFGYTAEEAIGQSILMLIPEERRGEEPEILRRIRSGEHVDHFETVRLHKDGSPIDISLTISPIKDDMGRVVGASKIARDIRERKRAEAQRDLLIAELSHRVKNTLATVISIARQSFANPNTDEARSRFDARIRGLARTHSRLAETSWSGVSLAAIVADECAPYRRDDGRNLRIVGPEIVLNPSSALTLGMAIHELATNAAKYGALSSKEGVVTVQWQEDPTDRALIIDWTERGGPTVIEPTRSGFGRLLLERALASDLRGDVKTTFAPEGLQCRISIPRSEYANPAR
jgi:PAS domain S-box-containing protein